MSKKYLTALTLGLLFSAAAFSVAAQNKPRQKADAPNLWSEEILALAGQVKEVDSPTLRAFLYIRIIKTAAQEARLAPRLANVVETGLADVRDHENEIPFNIASSLWWEIAEPLKQFDADGTARLRQKYALQRDYGANGNKEAGQLAAAIAKMKSPQASPQDAANVRQIITSGQVKFVHIVGELLFLDRDNAPILPQVLNYLLDLQEQKPDGPGLQVMSYTWRIFLKASIPPEIQLRFLNIVTDATRDTASLSRDPNRANAVYFLLQGTLPFIQKLTPHRYSEAAGQFALISGSNPQFAAKETVYQRIKDSSDPLAQTVSEAETAKDAGFQSELWLSATRLAEKQAKFRLAVEYALRWRKVREESGDKGFFEFGNSVFNEIVEKALQAQDPDAAHFAALALAGASSQAEAVRNIAEYFLKKKDNDKAKEMRQEAAKLLTDAPAGRDKSWTAGKLALNWAGLDDYQFREALRFMVKVSNNMTKPVKDPEGRESWSLFPVMTIVNQVFAKLGAEDRVGALNLAHTFLFKELQIAAKLGVYQSQTNTTK